MFFRRRDASKQVAKGAVFERHRPYNVTERAVILWVGPDATGIQHVRYRLNNESIDVVEDTRILSLATFTELYRPTPMDAKTAAA